ncbi:hypothetical protein CRG98_013287 [Punica granatum]|uniref:Retrotransposon gag domain-containing protein n=1 Tax=Punica granatum TaxID=22663 RepID=A0A2I0KCR5_PUNGR|nr:hypothetical protein CRG98_013287 [Punica granatum]
MNSNLLLCRAFFRIDAQVMAGIAVDKHYLNWRSHPTNFSAVLIAFYVCSIATDSSKGTIRIFRCTLGLSPTTGHSKYICRAGASIICPAIHDELAKKFVSQYGYNTGIAPSYLELSVMEMQQEQSFEDYATQWRAEVAKYRPPIDEVKQIQIFHGTLKGAYYLHLLGHMSSFNTMIKDGKKLHIFCQLLEAIKIIPKTPNANFNPANQDQSLRYECHMGTPRHTTDSCYVLRGKLRALIDKKLLSFNEVERPNV